MELLEIQSVPKFSEAQNRKNVMQPANFQAAIPFSRFFGRVRSGLFFKKALSLSIKVDSVSVVGQKPIIKLILEAF